MEHYCSWPSVYQPRNWNLLRLKFHLIVPVGSQLNTKNLSENLALLWTWVALPCWFLWMEWSSKHDQAKTQPSDVHQWPQEEQHYSSRCRNNSCPDKSRNLSHFKCNQHKNLISLHNSLTSVNTASHRKKNQQ